jgi:integrase/recombinase XerC
MSNLHQNLDVSNIMPYVERNRFIFIKDLPEYTSRYLKHIKYVKRHSENTIITYQTALTSFTKFTSIVECDGVLKPRVIRNYMSHLYHKGFNPKSTNLHLNVLRSFHRYCLQNELAGQNPASAIPQQKVRKNLPACLTEKEIIDVLDNTKFPDNFRGILDKTIIEMLYGTGCRLNELITIKESDIDDYDCIKLHGKGNKERIVPMPRKCIDLYQNYLIAKRKFLKGKPTEYLLVGRHGEQLNAMFVWRVIRKYFKHITRVIIHPHTIRHSYATHLLNNGAPIGAIGRLLGHASMQSTSMYIHLEMTKLKLEYAKVFK